MVPENIGGPKHVTPRKELSEFPHSSKKVKSIIYAYLSGDDDAVHPTRDAKAKRKAKKEAPKAAKVWSEVIHLR